MINILIAASLVGMVAVGHTYLIIAGQNDLSPGSLAAFSGVVAALLVSKGMPFAAAVIVTIVCGAAVGFFNAFMVNKIHLEAFIATLVTPVSYTHLIPVCFRMVGPFHVFKSILST